MISSLKSWQLRKAIINHPNHKKRINTAIANNGAEILILSDIEHSDLVRNFIGQLKKKGKNAKSFFYSAREVENSIGNILTPKQTKWYGVPQSENLEKALQRNYDMLIYLKYDIQPWDVYCLELIKSRFNIGPDIASTSKYFDLIIDQSNKKDIKELIETIKQQLAVLSRKYEK